MPSKRRHQHRTPPGAADPAPPPRPRTVALIAVALAAAVLAVFGQVIGFDYVVFDDAAYIRENPSVNQGLTLRGVVWALTTTYHYHWHPLTWLSHMLDVEIYGLEANGHHFSNLLLHLLNTQLLFAALLLMTRRPWRSGLVAALFALHPLHVEPVAWLVGRKDLLSTCFGLACLVAYLGYTTRRTWYRMLLALLLLTCGLMAKPLLITFPLVFLALDVWPLGRLRLGGQTATGQASAPTPGAVGGASITWRRALLEKATLFAIAAAGAALAVFGNIKGNLVTLSQLGTEPSLLATAAYGYVRYLAQTVWPAGLMALYPPQQAPAGWLLAPIIAIWLAAIALAWWQRRARPYLAVGGVWYLVVLLPMSGVLKAGTHRWADSYTYLATVGLFIAAVWLVADLCADRPRARKAAATGALLLLGLAAALSWRQTATWYDRTSFLQRVLAVDPDNVVAHQLLAAYALERNQSSDALDHLDRVLQQQPGSVPDLINRGSALLRLGRPAEAERDYREALRRDPGRTSAGHGLGLARARQGDLAGAVAAYQQTLQRQPRSAEVLTDLGIALLGQGQLEQAAAALRQALALEPGRVPAIINLGHVHRLSGRIDEAERQYLAALRLRPDDRAALRWLDEIARQRGAPAPP